MKDKVFSLIVALALVVLSCSRLKISRDISKEKDMDDAGVSQAYDSYSHSFILGMERRLAMNELVKHRPTGVLLDAGCGPGYLDIDIIRTFPDLNIIGLDISENMLRIAHRNIASHFSPHSFFFCKGDVHDIPLKTGSVDFVVSTGALHHWSMPERVFQEIYRILKPGGQFMIFDLRRDVPRISYALIWMIQRFTMPEPIRRANGAVGSIWSSFTPSELKTILASSPFTNWYIKKGLGWMYSWGQK